MQISNTTDSLASITTTLLAVGVLDGQLDAALAGLDEPYRSRVIAAARDEEFTGKAGTSAGWPSFGAIAASRLMLVGLGSGSPDELRRAAGLAGSAARARGARTTALAMGSLDADRTLATLEGFGLGNYRFEKYKPETERKALAESLVLHGAVDLSVAPTALAILAGQTLTRDLVNEGPDQVYPEVLANAAASLAGDGLSVEIWEESRILAEGMGGISAVGQGSTRPARFVHMIWRPEGKPSARLCVVGKGVTFDSGGLSLKPSNSMQTMRCDMSGAAAVVGLMRTLKDVRPDVEVHGIFGAVENMPSGNAYKLGDILRMYNGKTVEIHNTDAEGRLVLADCLHYASKLGVDAIVDLATLTGACVVALGEYLSGLFTANEALAASLTKHAGAAGEGIWRLPLAPDLYKDKIKADWGSLKNTGGREAGATTAALFLAEFVGETPWAHVDIAGPAFVEKPWRHFAAGGTGHMVATLTRWIQSRGA